jgi:hypothetical protein
MHAMALLVILLTVAAAMLSIGVFGDADRVRHRSTWRVLTAGSLILGLTMLLLLMFAQRPACDALGGRWIETFDACRNELGGNGNNDPSNPALLFLPV